MTGARHGLLTDVRALHEPVEKFIQWGVHVGRTVCVGSGEFQPLKVSTMQAQPLSRRGRANAIRAVVTKICVADSVGQGPCGTNQTGCRWSNSAWSVIASIDWQAEFDSARCSRQ